MLLRSIAVSAPEDRWLALLLRVIGTSSLLALVFVVVPHAAMSRIHAAIGLGELPAIPVIAYLTRSTSALYALVGGLLWTVSLDLPRHRRIVGYLGPAFASFGVVLLAVDWAAELPRFWALWEGPFLIAYGTAVTLLHRRARRREARAERA